MNAHPTPPAPEPEPKRHAAIDLMPSYFRIGLGGQLLWVVPGHTQIVASVN